jgi:hypothetical protein
MNLKKSNREGTGKKHPCNNCNNDIPLYKKYCNRSCYNEKHTLTINCIGCGEEFKVPLNKSEQIYCSILCSSKNIDRKQSRVKSVKTLQEKYGVNNPFEVKGYDNMNRIFEDRSKNMKEYWNNISLGDRESINKKISTSLLNISQIERDKINQKVQKTNLKKYGAIYPLCSGSILKDGILNKMKSNFLEELNVWLHNNDLELLDDFNGVKEINGDLKYYRFKHIPTEEIFIDHLACGRLPKYKDPLASIGISVKEKEIQSFLKEIYNGEIIFNNKKLVKGREIDIFIPEHNIAFEFNGIYWHSELNGKSKEYHIYKTEELERDNIKLIHIFEDEWDNKQEIVKSRIRNILKLNQNKIYARKCTIKEIDNKIKNKFLNDNHIQGEDKSKIKIGLFYGSELVSIMTFGSLRKITGNKSKEGEYELIRFCNKLNTTVIGSFSKLFKYFINTFTPNNIISYADRRWSQGEIYQSKGFNFIHNTQPNYWYMKYHKVREHRYKYRKSELHKILIDFDKTKSEWENMKFNGYDRIWDCGSKKYQINF